jgi:flagellar secretion chaperone FliS
MNAKSTESSYRRALVENASSVGLVIILYDLLIKDLKEAIAGIERSDTEARSSAIKHAFVVLQQLEGSLDHENGGEAARHLAGFYSFMRARIFEAHFKVSGEILNQEIERLLKLRQAWQQVDPANPASGGVSAENPVLQSSPETGTPAGHASWTA